MTGTPIRNVSDTAAWVAIYRAMESERPDAIFHDPYARRLGGERGETIVRTLPRGASMSWPMVVRTAVMDEIILRCVREGATTVLNLAAGLDARAYRLDLPPTLRWMHVDLPESVDDFRQQMAGETPRCSVEFIGADLRDASVRRDVFARAAANGPVLAITEGLLVYLEPAQVAELAADLHDVARARWWLTDLASPRLLKMLERRWQPQLKAGNAPSASARPKARHSSRRSDGASRSSVPPGTKPCVCDGPRRTCGCGSCSMRCNLRASAERCDACPASS